MTDHEVTWRIDQDVIYGGLTCNAPDGAPCRQGCGERCGAVNVHWDGDAWLWTYPENGAA